MSLFMDFSELHQSSNITGALFPARSLIDACNNFTFQDSILIKLAFKWRGGQLNHSSFWDQ